MRAWTKSACVVLAWAILPVIVVAVSMTRSAAPAQATTRTASSTQIILTTTVSDAPVAAAAPTLKYVVRSGDTLAAIAARFAVPGGWAALYAANRAAVGPDPGLIHPGTVLVVPTRAAPAHYTVGAGDTLSGIAAEFAVPGGWPALYAANRAAIGPRPGLIHTGTVLALPPPPAPPATAPAPGQAFRHHPLAPPSAPASPYHHRQPTPASVPAATGMPQWLKTVLVAVGLLILAAFLTEPALAARTRQRAATRQAAREPAAPHTPAQKAVGQSASAPSAAAQQAAARQAAGQSASAQSAAAQHAADQAAAQQAAVRAREPAPPGSGPACWPAGALGAQIVVADYHRLVVTRSKPDDTVYVLRPPGEDPKAILRVARLVLPEGPYGQLARQLGMPAIGPVE